MPGNVDGLVRQRIRRPRKRFGMLPAPDRRLHRSQQLQRLAFVWRKLDGSAIHVAAPGALPDAHSLRPGITAQLPVRDRPTPDHGIALSREDGNGATERAVHMCTPPWRKGARARLVRLRNESIERKEQHECPEGPGDREAAGASAWDEAHTSGNRLWRAAARPLLGGQDSTSTW